LENYFNYFTDIEEHFQRRRGTILLLSTLDWALIETWKNAGIPLEAVLRGIDATFDKWDKRPSKTRKVNGVGFCAQEVLAAAEEMREAEVGAARPVKASSSLPADEVGAYLERNAVLVEQARVNVPYAVQQLVADTAATLRDLSARILPDFEDLERRLTVLEDKLLAALLAATPDDVLVEARAVADREISAFRRTMTAPQITQLQQQYLHKRLVERYGLPRLSLFYMP